jgi:tyrosyl-tRNA synthetase
VHGADTAREMQEQAESVYGAQKAAGAARIVKAEIAASQLDAGIDIVELMLLAGMAKSKGEARRLLEGGGVYVSESRVAVGAKITREHVSSESLIELRAGKKNYFPVHVTDQTALL